MKLLHTSRDLLAARPLALEAAYALAGQRRVWAIENGGFEVDPGAEVRIKLPRADVFTPVPGLSPGGHPA